MRTTNRGLNALIALSDFGGGGLWVADASGQDMREVNGRPMSGRILQFQATEPCKSLIFDAVLTIALNLGRDRVLFLQSILFGEWTS
jgi:hypothetical protein